MARMLLRDSDIYPVALRELSVLRISDVTSQMRRVTLTGEQLRPFISGDVPVAEFRSTGFDDHIKLYFPYPGQSEVLLPAQRAGRLDFGTGTRPVMKSYTVRRWDRDKAKLDVDFVRHGTGVATTWAYRCAVGDRIHISGPGRSLGLPLSTDWLLLIGDETALPAIGRCLEELPEGYRAQVLIEVPDHHHEQELPTAADVTITWIHRHEAEPGQLLHETVTGLDWWPGVAFAWVAAEAQAVRRIRWHLLEDRGVPKEALHHVGYWRRREVRARRDDPSLPDIDAAEKLPGIRFQAMANLATPFAIRAAASLGLAELIARGVDDLDRLAHHTGSDPAALGKLLRYLTAVEILSRTPQGAYRLTELGEFLAHEIVTDRLDLNGAEARQDLAFADLLDAVRGDGGTHHGSGLQGAPLREDPSFQHSLLDQAGKQAQFFAPALASSAALSRVTHLLVHADPAHVIAREVLRRHEEMRLTLVAHPAQAAPLRAALDESLTETAQHAQVQVIDQQDTSARSGTALPDAVLFVQQLSRLADADAVRALRQAAQGVRRRGLVLVLEAPVDAVMPEEDSAAADLRDLALYGGGQRTDDEYRGIFESAGMRVTGADVAGQGNIVYVLEPQV
ncbi:siderophore-interacting protein [Ruania halotolerans]|uniref:siderophore-interacting protein n=1 Tax=Ruania halotolerans TaxID=2897773 RepID=UPI001E2AA29A|nr:siderophore-interacting protein [Ruania halotolerans]UFU05657.1 siderophore-interacting protein [Ruania halotolerans]